jgi:hypothetical protein
MPTVAALQNKETHSMKLRLTIIAMALSVLAISPVYAGGADGSCAYGSKYQQTSV